MLAKLSSLVTTQWLYKILKNGCPKDLRVLDASWHLPTSNRNGREEYKQKHIPEALYFDIDECCDTSSPYGHMLPSKEQFELYVGNLGIDGKTQVILYDNSTNNGFYSAPRVWWMFRIFGHEMVSILDGGFTKWCGEDLDTTSEVIKPPKMTFNGTFQPQMVKSFEDIATNINNNTHQVMDARGHGRFSGTLPEPRAGIESGHIIGAKNLCYQSIVDKDKGCLLDRESLERAFQHAQIDLTKPLLASCGSGVTACCIAFAAFMCDKEVPVYDGSWTEFYLRSTPNMRYCPSDEKVDT